jgi:hypothetical protein
VTSTAPGASLGSWRTLLGPSNLAAEIAAPAKTQPLAHIITPRSPLFFQGDPKFIEFGADIVASCVLNLGRGHNG